MKDDGISIRISSVERYFFAKLKLDVNLIDISLSNSIQRPCIRIINRTEAYIEDLHNSRSSAKRLLDS